MSGTGSPTHRWIGLVDDNHAGINDPSDAGESQTQQISAAASPSGPVHQRIGAAIVGLPLVSTLCRRRSSPFGRAALASVASAAS
jgi:hypothetical protein